jgi:hypothetical protein
MREDIKESSNSKAIGGEFERRSIYAPTKQKYKTQNRILNQLIEENL